MPPSERMLAVVFADVSGSTHLYETLGDTRAHGLIAGCLRTMRSAVEQFGGRVVKTVGDEILCAFDTGDLAISGASEMQSRLEGLRRADPSVPGVRIGVSYGPVLEAEDGDVFGDTVNLGARVAGLAKAGQVITTDATIKALSPLLRAACRALHTIQVKGKDETVAIFEVVWKVDESLTVLTGSLDGLAQETQAALRLSCGDAEVVLDGRRAVAYIGREPGNDLVVTAKAASRRHARVVLREGKFVLVDESANGTFVRFERQPELMLRREETVLLGRGLIGLGESTGKPGAELVAFVVD